MEFLLIPLVAGLLIWALQSAAGQRGTSGDAAGGSGGTCHGHDGDCGGDGGGGD